jgi:hypothetical protein
MPGGGACVILDYEVNMMAEYVSEMAIELVLPQSPVSPSFRKFVSQILVIRDVETIGYLRRLIILPSGPHALATLNGLTAQGHESCVMFGLIV